MMKMTRKPALITALIMMAVIIILQGCQEPAGIVVADKVKVRSRPQKLPQEVRWVGLCFGTGQGPGTLKVKLSKLSGLGLITSEAAFDQGFEPDKVVAGKLFYSWKDDPVKFTTYITTVSREAYKRTDVEFTHLLAVAGEPVVRDDAIIAAVGTKGSPGKGTCYLALLSFLTETVRRVVPPGYTDEELENGMIIPVMWEGKNIHAVLYLGSGRGLYFVSDDKGKISSSVNLEGKYIMGEHNPRGWRIATRGASLFILVFDNGYFLIDDKSPKAPFLEFDKVTRVIGVTDEGRELVVAGYDKKENRPAIFQRYPIGGDTAPSVPFGESGATGVIDTVVYSPEENCILYVDNGDIWRMDLASGVTGKMFETPGEDEVLLWAL